MKYIPALLVFLLAACQQPAAPSFSDRVSTAEALENTPAGALFIGALIEEHGESIERFAGECYADSTLEKDFFTVVADVGSNGTFENVVVQPESAPTRCYADKLGKLRTNASRPAGFADSTFPLVINVDYNK